MRKHHYQATANCVNGQWSFICYRKSIADCHDWARRVVQLFSVDSAHICIYRQHDEFLLSEFDVFKPNVQLSLF